MASYLVACVFAVVAKKCAPPLGCDLRAAKALTSFGEEQLTPPTESAEFRLAALPPHESEALEAYSAILLVLFILIYFTAT